MSVDAPYTQASATRADLRRGGRSLDGARDDALRDAALAMVAELGYDKMTMESIAARAGASKATIYRRWASKSELVTDAILRRRAPLETPNTGSLRGDLYAVADQVFHNERLLDTPLVMGLMNALLRDEELRTAVASALLSRQENSLVTILLRAVARGEIEPLQRLEYVVEVIPSLVWHRVLVTGRLPELAYIHDVIEHVFLPLVHFAPDTP